MLHVQIEEDNHFWTAPSILENLCNSLSTLRQFRINHSRRDEAPQHQDYEARVLSLRKYSSLRNSLSYLGRRRGHLPGRDPPPP